MSLSLEHAVYSSVMTHFVNIVFWTTHSMDFEKIGVACHNSYSLWMILQIILRIKNKQMPFFWILAKRLIKLTIQDFSPNQKTLASEVHSSIGPLPFSQVGNSVQLQTAELPHIAMFSLASRGHSFRSFVFSGLH